MKKFKTESQKLLDKDNAAPTPVQEVSSETIEE